MDKEVRELVEEATRQGWRCTLRANGHYQCLAPDHVGMVWIAGTPSDHRWKANTISKLRRHGFAWPPKG